MADKPGLSTLKDKGQEIRMAEISAICWNQLQKIGTEKHRKYHLYQSPFYKHKTGIFICYNAILPEIPYKWE
jgi:hypothetical protein